MDKIYAIEENKAKERLRLQNKEDKTMSSLDDSKEKAGAPFTISRNIGRAPGYKRGLKRMEINQKYEYFLGIVNCKTLLYSYYNLFLQNIMIIQKLILQDKKLKIWFIFAEHFFLI